MNNKEIRDLSEKELNTKIVEDRNMLTRIRLQHAVSPMENPNKIKENKRMMARLLTEKRSRELNKVQ